MHSVAATLAAVTARPDASRAQPVEGASFRYSVSAGVPAGPEEVGETDKKQGSANRGLGITTS